VRRILCVEGPGTEHVLDVAHVTLPAGASLAELLAALDGDA
jgi:hypothetical protein